MTHSQMEKILEANLIVECLESNEAFDQDRSYVRLSVYLLVLIREAFTVD